MGELQSVILIGQLLVTIISVSAVVMAAGKVLERLDTINKGVAKLTTAIESLDTRVDHHDVEIALLKQQGQFRIYKEGEK